MLISKKILSICLIVFTLFSCRKDFKRPNWDVDLLAPLVKTTLTLSDLLPDSIIQTNPDTSLKIVYQTDIFDIDMDSLFKIPDTTIVDVFSFPLSSIASPGNSFYSNDEELELNVSNGVELNYAFIESGFIELEVRSEIKEQIIVKYTIPSALKNGDTLVLEELIPAGTLAQDGIFTKTIDMSGYELDLTGISKAEVNTIVTRATGTVDTNATGPVVILAGEKITINNKLIDVIPKYVRGYFGNQQFRFGPETTSFTAFERIVDGTLDIEQVDVNLEFENGIGVDAQLTINQFETVNTNTGTNAVLNGNVIGSSININRGQETFSVPEVNYSNTSVSINTPSSNIDQLIEIFPNQLLYDINLNINPFGNISGGNDFVFKKHPLKTQLNVEFPLSIIANNLTLVDTLDFGLDTEETNGRIIDGDLILYADNGYPFEATIELELYDVNNVFISKIVSLGKIESAPVNAALRVTNKKSSRIIYSLSSIDIDNLYNAKKVFLKVAFTTTAQPQFVKIYEGYEIDIQLVGDFAYNLNFE
jgi:hypothetical protein